MATLAGLLDRARSIPRTLGRVDTRGYIPELDGLRFLAILFVLVWHASLRAGRYIGHLNDSGAGLTDWYAWFPHGEIGVILFFFISGFVVSQPFVSRPREKWKIGEFYKRRFIRIYPPYLVAMTTCFFVLAVVGHTPGDANAFKYATVPLDKSFLASLFYLHGIIFNEPSRLNPPMWSLEIEVLFYAVLPPLMLAYCAGRRRAVRIGALCAVIALAVAASSLMFHSVETDLRLRWGLFYHAYLFLMGVVVADATGDASRRGTQRSLAFDGLFAVGIAVLLGIGWMMTRHDARMLGGLYALEIQTLTIAAILMIFHGALHGRYASAFLSLAWLRLIGTMCYSLYLTHIVVMTAVGEVLSRVLHSHSPAVIYIVFLGVLIAASLVVGALFYVCVERPFAQRLARKPARPAVGLVGVAGAEPSR